MSFSSLFTGTNVAAAPTSGFAGLFSTDPNAAAKTAKLQQVSKEADAATAQAKSDSSIAGLIKNTIVGLPQASGIPQAFSSSFQKGVSAVDTIQNPKTGSLEEGLNAGLDLAEGVGGVALSPFAPIGNVFSQAINAVGTRLQQRLEEQHPGFDAFAASPAGDMTERILRPFASAGNIAMSILGAKAGELRPGEVAAHDTTTAPRTEATPMPGEKVTPIEPVKAAEAPKPAPVKAAEPVATKVGDKPGVSPETAPVVEKPVGNKVSGVAERINEAAVKEGLTKSGIPELAHFTSRDFATQSTKIADIVNRDFESAKAMVRGEVPLPKDISPVAFGEVLGNYAFDHNDVGLIKDIANSPMVSAESQAGSELGFARMRGEFSPVRAIRDIQKTRVEAAKKRGVETHKSMVSRLRPTLRKATKQTVSHQTVADFIKTIEC